MAKINFLTFARTEGRFSKHFDKDGNPSAQILESQEERLRNWHLLQQLAGIDIDGSSPQPTPKRKVKKEKNVTTN